MEPETVLPAQFFALPCSEASLRPEQRLALAVLENAVATLQTNATAQRSRGRRYFAEATEWFARDDAGWPFSFVRICDALGLDPEYLRFGLRRWSLRQRLAGDVRVVARTPFHRMRGVRRRIVG